VGSWGICFTYATMFALESLSLVGETYETSQSARRACDFLVSKQRADGGWGESYKVCHSSRTYSDEAQFGGQTCEACAWVEHDNTQVVQTSWAAMALMYAKYPNTEPIKRAVALVMSRQLPVRCLVPLFRVTSVTSFFFRMVHGRKRPSKGSSIGHVRFHIRTSSSRLLSGCLGRHKSTWQSAMPFR
jgi:hypothetical protein